MKYKLQCASSFNCLLDGFDDIEPWHTSHPSDGREIFCGGVDGFSLNDTEGIGGSSTGLPASDDDDRIILLNKSSPQAKVDTEVYAAIDVRRPLLLAGL